MSQYLLKVFPHQHNSSLEHEQATKFIYHVYTLFL